MSNILFTLILLSPFLCLQGAFALPLDSGVVVRVVDGDTLYVKSERMVEKVRLIGVDSPELHDRQTGKPQCFSREALRFSHTFLGNTVTLSKDPITKNRDVYGRLLRYVTKQGQTVSINDQLVSQGYARVYTRTPFSHEDTYIKKQNSAQASGRGMWDKKHCKYRL